MEYGETVSLLHGLEIEGILAEALLVLQGPSLASVLFGQAINPLVELLLIELQ